MLKHDDFGYAADEKTTECADPPVPERAEQGRQNKTHKHRKRMNVSMLPHYQRIFLQIGHVIEWRLRLELEQHPADVRMKKSFGDIVRVVFVVDMFMMPAMIARPHQDRIFERRRAKDQREQAHRQTCAKSRVRKQTVIAKRDAESGRNH